MMKIKRMVNKTRIKSHPVVDMKKERRGRIRISKLLLRMKVKVAASEREDNVVN